jgi:hypothetical protein
MEEHTRMQRTWKKLIRTLHRRKRLQQKFISPYMEESGISRHLFLFLLPPKSKQIRKGPGTAHEEIRSGR